MPAWLWPAAQTVSGGLSSIFGAANRKKGAAATDAAYRQNQGMKLGFATETPEERSQRAAWNRVANMYASGQQTPGEEMAYDRASGIVRMRRGQEFGDARRQLQERLARYGQSTSASGLAHLAKLDSDERRADEEANILEKASRVRDAEQRVAQGYSMIGSDLDRGYRNRSLMTNAVGAPNTAMADYYNEAGAGYSELGGELMGRGVQGLGNWWEGQYGTPAKATKDAEYDDWKSGLYVNRNNPQGQTSGGTTTRRSTRTAQYPAYGRAPMSALDRLRYLLSWQQN